MISTRTVVVAFVAVALILTFISPGPLARIAFPVLTCMVAYFLMVRDRSAYITFSLSIIFVSAFVRRVIDSRVGFQEQSTILLTPYLVTGLSGLLLLRSPKGLLAKPGRPLLLAMLAVFYGAIVGLTIYKPVQVAVPFLDLIAPLCFGYYVSQSGQNFEEIRQRVTSLAGYACISMGSYACYQFAFLPNWDRLWLENVHINSFGVPEAFGLRAFSTMNAPVVFSLVITTLLLISLNSSRKLRLGALPLGAAGLLLTLNRSAWIAFTGGLLSLAIAMSRRDRIRLIGVLAVILLGLVVFSTYPSINTIIKERIATFSSPDEDVSLQAREDGYAHAFSMLSKEPFGEGLGSAEIDHATSGDDEAIGPHDSVLLLLLYSVGWLGTALYSAAIVMVCWQAISANIKHNAFQMACRAALVALLIQSPLNDMLGGALGTLFWTFAMLLFIPPGQQPELGIAPQFIVRKSNVALASR